MPAFTTEQWIVLFLVLVLGWLLGLLSRRRGPDHSRALAEERERRIALERDHEARLAAANARIAELERAPDRHTPAGGPRLVEVERPMGIGTRTVISPSTRSEREV